MHCNMGAGMAPGTERKRVNLALQGGGAHGAFTWGVLDRLLEDDRIEIAAISGTSAGAMNAAILAQGMTLDGPAGARRALDSFWSEVGCAGAFSPLRPTPLHRAMGDWNFDDAVQVAVFDMLSRLYSPYQTNPFNLHPLRPILERVLDFDLLRRRSSIRLFICATHVTTGKVKVFDCEHLSVDAILASACLPFLFQAIEIDGEPYWDGGYMGNPAIFPLIYGSDCRDVVVVQVNPLNRPEVPRSAREILERVNEISFNSSLMREMRAIAFVSKMIAEERLDTGRYKQILVHWIENEQEMSKLGFASKLNADRAFLEHLKALGRRSADAWLDQNFDRIGVESTVDIQDKFL